MPYPHLEENTMGIEEIFAQFLINAIFSLVCGDGSVGESWIFLLYAMQVCVYVCGFGGRRRGRENGSRHENCKANRGKKFFLPLPLSLAPGQTKLMGRGKKKRERNPFSPCPTFDQQGLRFEEGGEKRFVLLCFLEFLLRLQKPFFCLHIKCPQLVRTAAGYARYAYMPKEKGGGEEEGGPPCMLDGKEAAKKSKKEREEKSIAFQMSFPSTPRCRPGGNLSHGEGF